MFNKRKMRMEELKEVCNSLLVQDAESDGIDLNIHPMTIGEYYMSDVFRQKTVLQKVKYGKALKNGGGFLDGKTGDVFIFIDKLAKWENIYSARKLAAIIFAVYHEYRHLLQFSGNVSSLDRVLIDIEKRKNVVMFNDYLRNHDAFFIEIDANLYAIRRTREYFKKYALDMYDEADEFLNPREDIANFYLNNFDFQLFFDEFYEMCEDNNIRISKFNSPILNVFYDDDNHFRTLEEILELSKMCEVDREILYGVLGSYSFLEQLEYESLKDEERKLIFKVLNGVIQDEGRRLNVNKQLYDDGKISKKMYLSLCDSASEKTTYYIDKRDQVSVKRDVKPFVKMKKM